MLNASDRSPRWMSSHVTGAAIGKLGAHEARKYRSLPRLPGPTLWRVVPRENRFFPF
jgi:hypothetical protein